MEVMEARLDEQVQKAMESSADVIWSPDNVTSDMTPPRLYETHCLPFYQKYHGMCRGAGKIYSVHMDGKLAALKELIARSLFDVIDSFSLIEVGGDLSILEAKSAWPDKVLCPNLPASICLRPPEEIRAYLKTISAEFGDKPFMLQISEDIPLDSYENVLPALTSQW
jgi:uroporphyrinogen-III decarboxylase